MNQHTLLLAVFFYCFREKVLHNDIPKLQETQDLHPREQQKQLDVSQIVVNIPESTEKHHEYCSQKNTLSAEPKQRLSVSTQKVDSVEGEGLIMDHECDTQVKDTHHGSKPSTINDKNIKESTVEAAGCDLKFATTVSNSTASSKDGKPTACNSIPLCSAEDQNSVTFLAMQRRCLNIIMDSMTTAEHLRQMIEAYDICRQSKRTGGNIIATAMDSGQSYVKPSQLNPEETKNSLNKSRYDTGSASSAQDLKCEAEVQFPGIIYPDTVQCQTKTCEDLPTADLNGTLMNDGNGMQDLRLNLPVVGTKAAKDMCRNFCVTEDNVSNGSTCFSGRGAEIKTEIRTEVRQSNFSPNTEFQGDVVHPLSFASLQEMGDRRLSDEKTKDEVVEPSDAFDELFQYYVTKLNVTARANGLEAAASDDSSSIAPSMTDIYDETDFRYIEEHQEEAQGAAIKTSVNDLVPSFDVRLKFSDDAKLNTKKERERISSDVFPLKHCVVLVDRLPDNSCHVRKNLDIPSMSGSSASLNSISHTSCSVRELQRVLSNEALSDESKVAILEKSRCPNTAISKFNLKKGHLSNVVKKRPGSGILVCKEGSSSIESTHCSTTAKTLLSSCNSPRTADDPSLPLRHGVCSTGKTSSAKMPLVSFGFSKLPPDSTLVSDRGIFATGNKEMPFACGHCGQGFTEMWSVAVHIMQQHDENPCVSCTFCEKRSAAQKDLRSHLLEEPLSSDQSGVGFSLESDLGRQIFNLTGTASIPGEICSKSVRNTDEFTTNSRVHKETDSFTRETRIEKETLSILCEQRLSDAPKQSDCDVSGKGDTLIMDFGCSPQQNETNVDSNGMKQFSVRGECIEKNTFEATASDLLKHLAAGRRWLSDIVNCNNANENLSRLFESEHGQRKSTLCENRVTSTMNIDQSCIEPARESPENSLNNIRQDGGAADDKRSSIASSNTEIFDETEYRDFGMNDGETQEAVIKTADNNSDPPVDVSSKFSNPRIFNKSRSEGRNAHEVVLSSNNLSTLVEQSQDNSCHVQRNGIPILLNDDQCQAETILPMTQIRFPTNFSDSRLGGSRIRHTNASKRSSHNSTVLGRKFAIPTESICNALRRPSIQGHTKRNSSKSLNGKRISTATGVVCEDSASETEGSQSKAPTVIPSSSHPQNFDSGTSSSCFSEFMASSELPPGSTLLSKCGIYRITNKDQPFACGYCGKAYKTGHSIYRHIRNRHKERSLDSGTSSSCFSDFVASSELPPGSTLLNKRGIYRTKDPEKPFACGYCGKAYKARNIVAIHIRNTHDEKSYSCEFCDKRFSTPFSLKDHVVIHSEEKPFACGDCGKAYKQRQTLKKHIRNTHDEQPYSCEFCGKGFSFFCHLKNHVVIHSQERPFTCEQCGKSFKKNSILLKHKSVHSEERLFPCKECSKSFKFKSVLKEHNEVHNTDQNREGRSCSICKRTFITANRLKSHMMSHTGEKPFKCSICGKQFRQRWELQRHTNTHSGVKKKKKAEPCSVCGKIVSVEHKAYHMRVHSGEKPFECNVCGKRFPNKQSLQRHIQSHMG